MNSKRILSIFAAAVVTAGLGLAGFAAPAKGPTPSPVKPRKPLVRLDLLQPAESTLAPERRNIFVAGMAAPETAEQIQESETETAADAASEKSVAEEGAAPIQYVGYVLSARGVIGLLIVQGTAQAVAQGDPVQPGFIATRITRKEIDVTGPDGKKKTYLLQGVQE